MLKELVEAHRKLEGKLEVCARCVPGPVTFPLSLLGLDRASSGLPQGQRPGFTGFNLEPKRALRRGYEQRQSFSTSGERQCHGSFHKVNSCNTSIKRLLK